MKYKIPFIKPELPTAEELVDYYEQIVESNWFSNFGPLEQKLCSNMEQYIGQNVSVTTINNATTGLMLAIKAVISPDSEKNQILIPAFTFAAGPEAIIWNGYQPVFMDIDQDTWQPDIKQAREYIKENSNKIAGVLFCNIFGVGTPEINDWEVLTKEFGLPLIIDSAAGFGSEYKDGEKLGARGDCEVFSFHVTKPFGVGEGGLVSSKSSSLIKKIRRMSNFGFNQRGEATELGLNAKMQEINAAIGLWQLEHIDYKAKNKQKTLSLYKRYLSSLGFSFQENSERSTVGFVSTLAPNTKTLVKINKALDDMSIEFNRYYNPPLHRHFAFSEYEIAGSLDNTENICDRIISLPSHDMVDEDIIKKVIELI